MAISKRVTARLAALVAAVLAAGASPAQAGDPAEAVAQPGVVPPGIAPAEKGIIDDNSKLGDAEAAAKLGNEGDEKGPIIIDKPGAEESIIDDNKPGAKQGPIVIDKPAPAQR
jgi:hypothetical protein